MSRPTAVSDELLKNTVEADPRQSVRAIADKFGIHHSTVVRRLKTIDKVKKLDTWVPHELTPVNKARRLEMCSSLSLRNKREGFLHRIVTSDEKWIWYDNRKRSAQWVDRDQHPGCCPKPPLHPQKVLLLVRWSTVGVIHHVFFRGSETITADRYSAELHEMHRRLILRHPAVVNRHGVLMLHDNARPHVAQKTVQTLSELQYETLPHPPYSPDLSPTDYHLFRHLAQFLAK